MTEGDDQSLPDESPSPSLAAPGGEEEQRIFRGRRLCPETDVYSFNTWDDVPWTAERQEAVEALISAQQTAASQLSTNAPPTVDQVMAQAQDRWNWFYQHHTRWFFKDRHWLPSEFPELFAVRTAGAPRLAVWEVGCGVGNTVFPLLKHHRERASSVFIYACDLSDRAVQLVRDFRDYSPDSVCVFQADITAPSSAALDCIADGSLDLITCIFVLSALDPARLPAVLALFRRKLRTGGLVLMRDYARGDLAQLRLRPERVVSDAVYTRGDGTAVHFFTAEEVARLAESAGFALVQNYTDRRLIVNRKRQLQMYRCWIQVKFQKT